MHDPMTVIRRLPFGGTLWHVDPESDGTDISCGWFSPKLTKKQISNIELSAEWEADHPFFLQARVKVLTNPAESLPLMRCAFRYGAMMLREKVSLAEIDQWSIDAICNHVDNFRSSLCFEPGYHSNFREDRIEDRTRCAIELFGAVARWILREHRPWWKHPRWHIRHWKVTFPRRLPKCPECKSRLGLLFTSQWVKLHCDECGWRQAIKYHSREEAVKQFKSRR